MHTGFARRKHREPWRYSSHTLVSCKRMGINYLSKNFNNETNKKRATVPASECLLITEGSLTFWSVPKYQHLETPSEAKQLRKGVLGLRSPHPSFSWCRLKAPSLFSKVLGTQKNHGICSEMIVPVGIQNEGSPGPRPDPVP